MLLVMDNGLAADWGRPADLLDTLMVPLQNKAATLYTLDYLAAMYPLLRPTNFGLTCCIPAVDSKTCQTLLDCYMALVRDNGLAAEWAAQPNCWITPKAPTAHIAFSLHLTCSISTLLLATTLLLCFCNIVKAYTLASCARCCCLTYSQIVVSSCPADLLDSCNNISPNTIANFPALLLTMLIAFTLIALHPAARANADSICKILTFNYFNCQTWQSLIF